MKKNIVYYHTAPYSIKKVYTEFEELPKDYVRVRIQYCGICGGDYSYYIGRRTDYPVSLGHEWVGKIIEVGCNVKNFSLGMSVVTDFNYRCGECEYCRSKRSHLCMKNNIQHFSNRGFAQYADVHYHYLYAIPEIKWMPRACLIEPLSCVIHALQNFNIDFSKPVLLCGGGSIGMLICFYLTRRMSYQNIYVAEKNQSRLEMLIEQFGVKRYDANSHLCFDIVIDCTNDSDGLSTALSLTNVGGNICIISHLYGESTSFIYENICKKELHAFFPLRNGDVSNIITAIDLIRDLWCPDDDRMIEVYSDVESAFSNKNRSQFNKQVILLNSPA